MAQLNQGMGARILLGMVMAIWLVQVCSGYTFRYELLPGDLAAYNISHTTGMSGIELTQRYQIRYQVVDVGPDRLVLMINLSTSIMGTQIQMNYTMVITKIGEILELSLEHEAFGKLRITAWDLKQLTPNTLRFPEQDVKPGDRWSIPLDMNFSYELDGIRMNLSIAGTEEYFFEELAKISVPAGEYQCARISSIGEFLGSMEMLMTFPSSTASRSSTWERPTAPPLEQRRMLINYSGQMECIHCIHPQWGIELQSSCSGKMNMEPGQIQGVPSGMGFPQKFSFDVKFSSELVEVRLQPRPMPTPPGFELIAAIVALGVLSLIIKLRRS